MFLSCHYFKASFLNILFLLCFLKLYFLRFTNFDKYFLARGFDVNQNAEAMIPISGKGHNILHMDFLYEYDESSSKPQVWIYWVDFESDEKGHNGIYRIRPDGTQLEHVIKDGIGKSGLRGIAVDWVS